MKTKTIKRGDCVIDIYGDRGIVVKIVHGHSVEEHGTIAVWQMDRTEYGADNCEHYPYFGWEKVLRILKDNDMTFQDKLLEHLKSELVMIQNAGDPYAPKNIYDYENNGKCDFIESLIEWIKDEMKNE